MSISHSIQIITLHIEISDEYPLQEPIFTIDMNLHWFEWKFSLAIAIADIKTVRF